MFKHFNTIYTLDTQNDKLSKKASSFPLFVYIKSLLLNIYRSLSSKLNIEISIKKIINFFKNVTYVVFFAQC